MFSNVPSDRRTGSARQDRIPVIAFGTLTHPFYASLHNPVDIPREFRIPEPFLNCQANERSRACHRHVPTQMFQPRYVVPRQAGGR
jgi:hypothetical protein